MSVCEYVCVVLVSVWKPDMTTDQEINIWQTVIGSLYPFKPNVFH